MSCDLSIIVVSYNTRDLTLACLDSVRTQTTRTPYELLVEDNNSSDGSAPAIAEQFPDATLVERSDNIGFAAANNDLTKQANGQWILLLNPDTVVLDGAIDTLFEFAQQHPGHGIYGGRTLFPDGSLNPTSCWGRMTPWSLLCRACGFSSLFRGNRLFDSESLGGWKRDSIRQVDIVTGCFFLIPRSLWEQLGGFDKGFYMYGEEVDLCLRAKALGAKPIICPDAAVIHYGGASDRVKADKMVRLLQAKSLLIDKHWGPAVRPVGQFLLQMWPFSRMISRTISHLVKKSQTGSEGHSDWSQIWSRRSEWKHNRTKKSAHATN